MLEVVAVLLLASALIGWFAVVRNQSPSSSLLPNKEELLRKMAERPAVSLTNAQKQALFTTMVDSASTNTPTPSQRADLLKQMVEGK